MESLKKAPKQEPGAQKEGLNATRVLKADDYKPQTILAPEFQLTRVAWGLLNQELYATTSCGKVLKFDFQGKIINQQQVHHGEARQLKFSKDFSILGTCG